jgi:hypothetical protein
MKGPLTQQYNDLAVLKSARSPICVQVDQATSGTFEAFEIPAKLFPHRPPHEESVALGHINRRPITYWLSLWEARGWEPIEFDTLAFRSLATFSWLRRNPVILRRSGRTKSDTDGRAVIEVIGSRGFQWYGQDAEIIEYPLTQDPPDTMYESGFSASP